MPPAMAHVTKNELIKNVQSKFSRRIFYLWPLNGTKSASKNEILPISKFHKFYSKN